MRIEFIQAYKQVHTWTGIVAGLFLYIAFLAGALTMFKAPLNQWALQSETTLPAIARDSYDTLIQKVLAKYPEAAGHLTVYLPEAGKHSAPVSWEVEDHDTHTATVWHASLDEHGELVTAQFSVSAIGEFIDHLHRTAGIPGGSGHDAIGTYVLGVVAGLYFVALVSGLIVFLPTWFKDFLSLRRGKNVKRYWLDFHNVLGVTSLPFHFVIAFTAFVFAFHDPIYATLKHWVYGDAPMFTRPAPQTVRPFSELAGIEQIEQSLQASEPEFRVAELTYLKLDSPRPGLRVGGYMDGYITRGAEYTYVLANPFTAELPYNSLLPNHFSGYSQIVISFFALHFGNFGGLAVRWIYFGLGIMGALLFLTGNILWIESRRKKQPSPVSLPTQKRSPQIMARLTVGVCLGAIMGITLSMLAAKCLPHSQVDIVFWQQFAYYCGFLLSLGWAWLTRPMLCAQQLLLVNGALLLLIPLYTVWQRGLVGLFGQSAGVHLSCMAIAVVLLLAYSKLRRRQHAIDADDIRYGDMLSARQSVETDQSSTDKMPGKAPSQV